MTPPQLRPTFRVQLDHPKDTAADRIRSRLVEREELQGRWQGKGRWVEIHVPSDERKLWSPHLSLRVDEAGEGSELFGRFAPHPEVWTFFMFLYFGISFVAVLGGIFGYVQWASDEPAWGLWALWIGVPLLALLHVTSAVGQRLGREQMRELQSLLFEVLEEMTGSARTTESP